MKKSICYVFYMLVALLSFCCNTVYVSANDHSIIYDIEKLNFKTNEITIKGFSFIDHYDNYGGVSGYKNLTTWIIVSKASRAENALDRDHFVKEVNPKSKDLYVTRCVASGCSNTERLRRINNKVEENYCNRDGNSRCSYHDVGFEVSLKYEDIFKEIGEANELYFYIKSEIKYKNGVKYSETIGLGVNKIACTINSGSNACRTEVTNRIRGNDYTFGFEGISSTVAVTASSARIMRTGLQPYDQNHFAVTNGYPVKGYGTDGTIQKCTDNTSSGRDCVEGDELNFYKLGVDHSYGSGSTTYRPGNGASYYAHAAWVQVEGELVLKNFKEDDSKTGCNKIPAWSTGSSNPTEVGCENTVNYKTCINKDNISGTIYFRSSFDKNKGKVNSDQCRSLGGYWDPEAQDGAGRCFFPVNFTASLSILEEGTYTLGGVSPSSNLKNGQPFNFSSSSYTNSVSWINRKWGNNAYAFNIAAANDYSCKNGNCEATPLSEVWYGTADDNGRGVQARRAIYCSPYTNRCVKYNTPALAAAAYINDYVASQIVGYSNKTGIINSINYTSSEYTNPSAFPGQWTVMSINGNPNQVSNVLDNKGRAHTVYKVSASYNYGLKDGYLNIKNRSITYNNNVGTSADYVNFGKRLFVPLKYNPGLPYIINLNGSQISFVDGINWSIAGQCSVGVIAGLYDCPDGGCDGGGGGGNCDPTTNICDGLVLNVAYRPISVNEPFPAGAHTPINWSNYISAHGLDRIKKSYTYKPDYTYNGTLNFNSDGKYGNWNNIDPSGASRFVTNGNGFNVNANGDNYCGLGSYSDSCNKVG